MSSPGRQPGRGGSARAAQPRILIARTAHALGLDARQAFRLRRVLREQRRQLQAVRERLAECRLELQAALAQVEPDAPRIWELACEERVLLERERAPGPDVDPVLSAILTREQMRRLRRSPLG